MMKNFILLLRDGIDICTTTFLLFSHSFHFAFISRQKFMCFICVGSIRPLSCCKSVQILLSIIHFFSSFLLIFSFVVIFAIFQFLCSFLCHFHPQCVGKMTSSSSHYDIRLCIQGIETCAKSWICC